MYSQHSSAVSHIDNILSDARGQSTHIKAASDVFAETYLKAVLKQVKISKRHSSNGYMQAKS